MCPRVTFVVNGFHNKFLLSHFMLRLTDIPCISRNLRGQTPEDLATTPAMRKALNTKVDMSPADTTLSVSSTRQKRFSPTV